MNTLDQNPIPERYQDIAQDAQDKGWDVEYTHTKGLIFRRGRTSIWQCCDGWQCADLIDGYFVNHRGLRAGVTLIDLLDDPVA